MVPWRDRRADTDRLLGDQHPMVVAVGRDDIAIDAAGLLGEELDEGGGIGDLALGLGQRLALLGGHDQAEIVRVGDHQVEPLAQDVRALLGGLLGPQPERPVGMLDGFCSFLCAEARHMTDGLAGGRIDDRIDRRADPFAVHEALRLQERRVFQRQRRGLERRVHECLRHAGEKEGHLLPSACPPCMPSGSIAAIRQVTIAPAFGMSCRDAFRRPADHDRAHHRL
jgi:hypothetical protein